MTSLRSLLARGWVLLRAESELFQNFLSLGVIQVAAFTLPLITLPYVLRTVGIGKYGILAVAHSLTAYFVLLTDYGFRISATREVSIHRADRRRLSGIFSSVLLIKASLMGLSLLVLAGVMAVSQRFGQLGLVQWFSFGLVGANVLSLTWFFQGVERMKYITVLSLLAKAVYTVSLFVWIRRPEHYLWIPLISSGSEILAGLAGLGIALTHFRVRFLWPSWRELRRQAGLGWHVFVSTLAINAYSATPVFALGLFAGTTVAGLYALAERLAQVYQTFPIASLLQALYPRLSAMFARRPRESYDMMARAQTYTTVVYVATFPLLLAISPLVVRLVAGQGLSETVLCFGLLAAAVVVINANAFRLQFLLVSGRQNVYAGIHVAAGLVGSGLVFAGARLFSYTGPAIALILTNLLVLAWTVRAVRRAMPLPAERSA